MFKYRALRRAVSLSLAVGQLASSPNGAVKTNQPDSYSKVEIWDFKLELLPGDGTKSLLFLNSLVPTHALP